MPKVDHHAEANPVPASGLVIHYLGTVTPREDVERLARQDRFLQTASNELQWNYVQALRGADLAGLNLFAAPAVSEYPRFPRILVTAARLELNRDAGIRFVPFVNVMGIKQVTQVATVLANMWPSVWRWRRTRSVVLIFSLQSPFLLAALLFRRITGSLAVAIIPDLSEFMHVSASRRGFRAFLKSLDVRLGRRLLSRIDGAIVVTRDIATDRLPPSTPFLVVDSIREVDASPSEGDTPDSGIRSILYSGVLEAEYGLRTLLDAFASLDDPECELWLTGKGQLEMEIRERAARDRRIRYLGHIPLADLRATQARASLLVSVKPSRAPFTRYSFPSKITEYMAAGRPVASTVCPGIDESYFRFVHRLNDETPETMRRSLEEFFRMDPRERQRRAHDGVAFLRETRSPSARAREIVAFLEAL